MRRATNTINYSDELRWPRAWSLGEVPATDAPGLEGVRDGDRHTEQALERHFRERVAALSSRRASDLELDQPVRDGTRLTARMALAVFDAMQAQ